MRRIRLHDTRTGRLQELRPRDGRRVGIYACGPTVYARIHVGNARPFVVFMLLARFLRHEGYEPVLAANVTDINDKIYDAARAAGRPSDELARDMTAHYVADTDRLELGRPDHEPLATEMVDQIVALIGDLLERGHAYEADGDVYFRVRSLPRYGELSHRDVDQMDQGEGVEGADRKEDPLDFALWKAEKPLEDTAWDAPWGRGRPGWHIECSAMAESLLGLEFEIHGGGIDLVFPHHENEAAQTLAARGRPLARTWMHNGMIELGTEDGAEKMSKSLGNIRGLAEVLDEVGRDALIMYFCEGHYRQPLAFTRERFDDASRRIERIRDAGRRLAPGDSPEALAPHRDAFFAALADDFNTPRALAALSEWIRDANRMTAAGGETAAGETAAGETAAGETAAGETAAGEAAGGETAAVGTGAGETAAGESAAGGTAGGEGRGRVGDGHLREMLGVLGLENLLARGEGPPAEVLALAERRAEARARRDFGAADRLRDELLAQGWVVRDGPQGPELVPAGP